MKNIIKILILLLQFSLVKISTFGKYYYWVQSKLLIKMVCSCFMLTSLEIIHSEPLRSDSLLLFTIATWINRVVFATAFSIEITHLPLHLDTSLTAFMVSFWLPSHKTLLTMSSPVISWVNIQNMFIMLRKQLKRMHQSQHNS